MKMSYELSLFSLYGLNRCKSMAYSNSYVLDEFDIDYTETFWRNSVIILVHFLVYRLIFWIILITKVNKQNTISRPELNADNDLVDIDHELQKNK